MSVRGYDQDVLPPASHCLYLLYCRLSELFLAKPFQASLDKDNAGSKGVSSNTIRGNAGTLGAYCVQVSSTVHSFENSVVLPYVAQHELVWNNSALCLHFHVYLHSVLTCNASKHRYMHDSSCGIMEAMYGSASLL